MRKSILFVFATFILFFFCACGSTPVRESASDFEDYSSQIFTMGTVFTVRAISEEGAQDAVLEAEQVLYDADHALSWRTEGSAADIFNREHRADVSGISDLIRISLEVCEESGGAFDLTVLPLTQLWQFDKLEEEDFDSSSMIVPSDEEIRDACEKIDYKKLSYDRDKEILSSEDADLGVELGAVGKGWAIDRALSVMKEKGTSGAMISAGSSIGLFGTKAGGEAFKVAIRDPRGDISDYLGILTVTDCTVSTSGDYERYFEKDGIRYHHILDPHTGYPADSGLMQVTVIGENGTLGDALSTACFVLGLDEGMRLAEENNVLAIFVDTDKKIWYNNSDIISILELVSDEYTLNEYHRIQN